MAAKRRKNDSFHLKQLTVNTILFAVFSVIIVLILILNYRINIYDKEVQRMLTDTRELSQLRNSLLVKPYSRTLELRMAVSERDCAHAEQLAADVGLWAELSVLRSFSAGYPEDALADKAGECYDRLTASEKRVTALLMLSCGYESDAADMSVLTEEELGADAEKQYQLARVILGDEYTALLSEFEAAAQSALSEIDMRIETAADITENNRNVHEPVQLILIVLALCYLAVLFDIINKFYDEPVLRYTEAVKQYRTGFPTEIDASGTNEVYQLGIAITQMTDAVNKECDELRARISLLTSEKNDAVTFGTAKVSFLRELCNAIHSQLNNLVGYEYLLRHSSLNDTQQKYSEKIGESAGNMLELMSNIIMFSQLTSTIDSREQLKFNMDELLNRVTDAVALDPEASSVAVEYRIDSGVSGQLLGDVAKLSQCIVNLICAAAHSSIPKAVRFSAVCTAMPDKDSCVIEFSVTDGESSMTPQQLERLCGIDVPPDIFRNDSDGINGLRIAISEHLAVLLGGRLSAAVVKGVCEFRFAVPFAFISAPDGASVVNSSALSITHEYDDVDSDSYTRCIDIPAGTEALGPARYASLVQRFLSTSKNDIKYAKSLINSGLFGNATRAISGLSAQAERLHAPRISSGCTAVLRELSETDINTYIIFKLLSRLEKDFTAARAVAEAYISDPECTEFMALSPEKKQEYLAEILADGNLSGIYYFEQCLEELGGLMLPADFSHLEKAAYAYSTAECAAILRSMTAG